MHSSRDPCFGRLRSTAAWTLLCFSGRCSLLVVRPIDPLVGRASSCANRSAILDCC
ncbi:hypothetical protein PF005_g30751 [Phytophthora fragariae]|uniref:Uncharacterized protein n=2 Tax=Phytophthora TaxID=4783 RepID=A0A6A3VJL0_9STRA|nr:hypothetical protein PF009_g30962 [Phytophthora fragariae]KAE8961870.1 hypothetical protein PR002_g29772 [Phytophthora rubi]KAE8961467.1 hypothetical protein PF011_g29739 [Phytophthora fragariae]KAE8962052.1 hypothetical protein PR001_g29836 [Phytophthora rubi]KAE9060010.1 hypothetical protein PF010_g30385 [Phytophthora fragariae]